MYCRPAGQLLHGRPSAFSGALWRKAHSFGIAPDDIKRGHEYLLRLTIPRDKTLLTEMGLWGEGVPEELVRKRCCAIAFLRGVF